MNGEKIEQLSMLDIKKNYKTREGREVRIYATDGAGTYPVQGAIKNEDGWYLAQWKQSGKHVGECDSSNDLVEFKHRFKIEQWVVFEDDGSFKMWNKKPSDEAVSDAFAVKHIVVEVEQGEGFEVV
jgi:hypothetical protein